MQARTVNAGWSRQELLAQEGIFFLKDIVGKLELTSTKVKQAARAIAAAGQCPYRVMGARKVWNHWAVRMSVFRGYYLEHFAPVVRRVEADWNGNRLLQEKGLFVLADVCHRLPFNAHQLRYQAKTNPDSRRQYGIWKDPAIGAYVVDMEPFAAWIGRLWRGAFR